MLTNESTNSTTSAGGMIQRQGRHHMGGATSTKGGKPSVPGILGMALRHWRRFLAVYFALLHVIVYVTLLRSQRHHVVDQKLPGFVDVHEGLLNTLSNNAAVTPTTTAP